MEGDPATSLSFVPRYLFDALDELLPIVDRLDFSPHGAARVALAAATFRPSEAAWRARFHTSRIAQRALSATLRRRVGKVEPAFDGVLQIYGWVAGQPRPYALYVDQTRLMAERGWPDWMPLLRGERSAVLEHERAMYADAAHVFVMGRAAKHSLQADYGVAESRISVVGGGLNLDCLPEVSPLAETPRILFVGRDFERKGGDCLLEAFAAVRAEIAHAQLDIVGVERRFDLPGVQSHGKLVSRRDLLSLYRCAGVFCMPSLYEPWGLVFGEAMACGVPCVGTVVQSIPEILGHGSAGLLVEPNAPQQLAEALIEILTDRELAHRLARTGRRRVERELTWERVAGRMAPVLARRFG